MITAASILAFLTLVPADMSTCDRTGAMEAEPFAAGEGTPQFPYLICSTAQLKRVAERDEYLLAHFQLGRDLVLGDAWSGMDDQIGRGDAPFRGLFDGQGFSLTDVRIDGPAPEGTSLFHSTDGAIIGNLTLLQVSRSSGTNGPVASLVGRAEDTIVDRVHAEVDLMGGDHVGGLVAVMLGGQISNSSVRGVFRLHFGPDATGGVVGFADGTLITSVSSHVRLLFPTGVHGQYGVGGLVGVAARGTTIRNCYATGDLVYVERAPAGRIEATGGLVGLLSESSLAFAFYSGRFSIEGETVGAVVGAAGATATVSRTYWDTKRVQTERGVLGTALRRKQMRRGHKWRNRGFDESLWNLPRKGLPSLASDVF